MIEFIISLITEFISFVGYIGIFLLMVMESMIFPVPSEAVMPFAGYLAYTGKFNFFLVILVGTLGTIVGSLISYFIGFQGEHLIKRYHRIFLLNEYHLEITKNFFSKYGAKAIFISRFIPIARHLISIPAGMGRMNLHKFILYTFLGGFMWNFILAYSGYQLKDNWTRIEKYTLVIDILLVIAVAAFLWYVISRKFVKKSSGT